MDFRFSDDQLTLAESVRDYLAGTHGPEVLRRLDAEGNRDPAIWQGLVEMLHAHGPDGVLRRLRAAEEQITAAPDDASIAYWRASH